MTYKSFIKKSVGAAVAGGGAYLAAKYSGHGLDMAVIAASARIVTEEVEDLAEHVHRGATENHIAVEPELHVDDEKSAEFSVDCQAERRSAAMRLH